MQARVVDSLIGRYDKLKSGRGNWDTLLQQVAEYCIPRHAEFQQVHAAGTERNNELFDSTGQDALQLLAAALHGLITNPYMAWFGFSTEGMTESLSQASKEWIDTAVRTMKRYINSDESNFVPMVHESFLEIGAFGTGCLYTEETDNGFFCRSFCVANVMFSEDSKGRVDSVFRRQLMTSRQIVQEWPDAPKTVQDVATQDPDKEFTVLHVVLPRGDAGYGVGKGKVSTQKPFASYWVLEDEKVILSEGGYDELPYHIGRWSKSPSEIMGRGPGVFALPFLRSINAMTLTAMMAAEKLADPPIMVPDDGFLGPIDSGAGGLSYYRKALVGEGQDIVRTLPVSADLSATQAMIEWREIQIRKMFLNDQLQTFENPNMTATQVLAIQSEKMRVLGPILARLSTEFLTPFVVRVFNILLRKGIIEPAPDELQGMDIAIEYKNPVASNQRQVEAQSFSMALQYLMPVVQANPGVLDNFDGDSIVRDSKEVFGFPAKYLVGVEERDQRREAQAQQAQEMQQAALAKEAVDTAANAKQKGLMDE